MRFRPAGLCVLGVTLAAAGARADDNDLVLARLARLSTVGDKVVPNNQDFRSLMSEYGVAMAPQLLSPSDTLGFAGFQFATQLSFTTISNDQGYWCATEQSTGCAAGFDRSKVLPTLGIFARKGIWLPLPSFEIGAGAVHLLSSRAWTGQLYAKFAIQEGYHDWPIPSIAVRGAVSRLLGYEQLSLTVASFDVSISKRFGVAGTFSFAPYAGWNPMWIVPRSQVIDRTPGVASTTNPDDMKNNFVFPDQDAIFRHRFFVGFKLKYYVFSLTAEASFTLAGSSVDDRPGTDMPCSAAPADLKGNCDATDQAKAQATYSASLSLDF
ncbi:MAG TPA: hypothetical protein VKE22_26925 [Haliangiales bacterium]|nr:hypothetical protein [Haliangiales bacterium]